MIDEPESAALERHLSSGVVATSRLALVEVSRATRLANPAVAVREETDRLLASCMLIDVSDELLRAAARLASLTVRTLDAVHIASALWSRPDAFVAYDRRLLDAAVERGLDVASPGLPRAPK